MPKKNTISTSHSYVVGNYAPPVTLTGHAGLSIFARYLKAICRYPVLGRLFDSICKSREGLPAEEIFKQLFCISIDGTSRPLVYVGKLKKNSGHAGNI